MFNRGLALAAAAMSALGDGFKNAAVSAQSLTSGFSDLNPTRIYGPRVVTHKNIGRHYGCSLRHMTRAEVDALPLIERQKGPRDGNHVFLTHEHRRRYTPHTGKKEIARHSARVN